MPGVSVLFFQAAFTCHLLLTFTKEIMCKQNQNKNFWTDIKIYLKLLVHFSEYCLKNYSRLGLLLNDIVYVQSPRFDSLHYQKNKIILTYNFKKSNFTVLQHCLLEVSDYLVCEMLHLLLDWFVN